MTDQFHVFAAAIRRQFDALAQGKLYVVATDRDQIWHTYLNAFPEGSNPVFRTNTEHDCGCCRAFIRSIGNVVAINGRELISVWDVAGLPSPYAEVAEAMSAYVRSRPITDVFLTTHAKHGQPHSHAMIDGKAHTWNHFSVEVPRGFVTNKLGMDRGDIRTTVQVFLRGVQELSADAIDTVLELIANKQLYRGEEHVRAVKAFKKLHELFRGINDPLVAERLAWQHYDAPAARFRNTVIGTLVTDLSTGVDLEKAVKTFESKVAPQNYKRPTALITPRMITDAMNTIQELGLEPALERRHARLEDVSVNSVLWVDNAVASRMKGGLADLLMAEVKPAPFDKARAEEIDIVSFVSKLPAFSSVQVYLEGAHLGNFMSLTAPVHADSKKLFRWGNDFAWSYDGNVTDSLKQKVAALGGRVDGVLRFSHTWNYDPDHPNQSLMDLHVFFPGHVHRPVGRSNNDRFGGYYGDGRRVGWDHRKDHLSGAEQDVDFVNPPGKAIPVENITFPDLRRMPEGTYTFKIHNWNLRQPTKSGFKAEIEFAGQTYAYEHPRPLGHKEWVTLAEVTLHRGTFTIKHLMPHGERSQEKWGLKTQTLVKASSVILSPNHWDGAGVGNKHWFFILDGCLNPEPVRGIYNEYLHPSLEKHRKVFEVLGDKTKCPPVAAQMSGLGFSAGRGDKVTVQVAGPKLNKVYTITF